MCWHAAIKVPGWIVRTRSSLFRDIEYTFKHALTHQSGLRQPAPGNDVLLLHVRMAGKTIERMFRTGGAEQIDRLADAFLERNRRMRSPTSSKSV